MQGADFSSGATPAGRVIRADVARSDDGEHSPLTEEQLKQRVTLGSPALLKELYELAQRQILAENGRQSRLDAKGTSLLTAAGLALTVAFTFGGQIILGHRSTSDTAHILLSPAAQSAFAIGVIFGLAAACFAVWALFVRGDYLTLNEHAVFSEEALKVAEDVHHPDEPGSDEIGLAEYRKALIPHLWLISQKHASVHEKKARLIKLGQGLFLLFLVSQFLLVISLMENMR